MNKTNKTNKNKKTVFAVINLANTTEQQENVAEFASEMAKSLCLHLVFYPQMDDINISFAEGLRRIEPIGAKFHGGICTDQVTLWKSLPEIAAQEQAAFIIMGIKEDIEHPLGKTVWKATEKSNIPILLIPSQVAFGPFKQITIAMDAERKLGKMAMTIALAKKFKSMINVFVENASDRNKENTTSIMVGHVEKRLMEEGIPCLVTKARKPQNFTKHLCKFASKKSNLLIIEVEQGKIDSELKTNIETLLHVNQKFPVLFVKTKDIGNAPMFN